MDPLYKKYEEERKAMELENTKLKLKMVSRNLKTSKTSVDDYINNILGSGLKINKPLQHNKFESQSVTNISNKSSTMNVQNNLNQSCYFPPQKQNGNNCHSEASYSLPSLYEEIIDLVKLPSGDFDTAKIYEVFVSSGLSQDTLGTIWQQINRTSPGTLTKHELIMGLAMIALCQQAHVPTSSIISVPTWDHVVHLSILPVPRVSATTSSAGLDSHCDQHQLTTICNQTEITDEWADFTDFTHCSDTGSKTTEIDTNHAAETTHIEGVNIVPLLCDLGVTDIRQQINDQFSNWHVSALGCPEAAFVEKRSTTTVVSPPADADFGDFQIFSSTPDSERIQPPAAGTSADRYELFNSELGGAPCDNLVDQWVRCLAQAQRLLTAIVTVLRPIQTEAAIKSEVFGAEKGVLMLKGIIEVYRVTRNIKLSASRANILTSSKQMLDHLSDIERFWNEFMLTIPDEIQIDVQTRLTRGAVSKNDCDDNDLSTVCGVCLCRLDPEDGFLSHGLHRYHCPCANLWVNTLDLTLPGLTLPQQPQASVL